MYVCKYVCNVCKMTIYSDVRDKAAEQYGKRNRNVQKRYKLIE